MEPVVISDRAGFAKADEDLARIGVRDLAIKREMIGEMGFMVSAWMPTDAELALLNLGAPVLLGISTPNAHPVCNMRVGEPPRHDLDGIPILYAKVDVTPGWQEMEVVDLDTGQSVPAIECDVTGGWAIVHEEGPDGRPLIDPVTDTFKNIIRQGRYEIRRMGK